MIISKKNRQEICKYLFREGVLYAKKDFSLRKHPLVDVPNLQVIKLMQSFKSKEYVRETIAWQHYYWYLTNDGVEHLRTYLNLSSEIVPATWKKTRGAPSRPFGYGPPSGPPRSDGSMPRSARGNGYCSGPCPDVDFGKKDGASAEFQSSFANDTEEEVVDLLAEHDAGEKVVDLPIEDDAAEEVVDLLVESSGPVGTVMRPPSKYEAPLCNPYAAAIVRWTELPDLVTTKILNLLPPLGYAQFGAVCSAWAKLQSVDRLVHLLPVQPSMLDKPWFIQDMRERGLERRTSPFLPCYVGISMPCLQRLPPQPAMCYPDDHESTNCFPLRDGFLLRATGFTLGYYLQFCLVNPISQFWRYLPGTDWMGPYSFDFKAALSPIPELTVLVIVDYGSRIYWYNPTYERFHKLEDRECKLKGLIPRVPLSASSVIWYKGSFYCFFLGNGIIVVDPNNDSTRGQYMEMDQSQLPVVNPWGDTNALNDDGHALNDDEREKFKPKVFLAESLGKLLLVLKFFENGSQRFELFDAKLSERRWVRLESLLDQVLVIYRSFVVSFVAADIGVERNSIYIAEPEETPMLWTIFNLGTGEIRDADGIPPPPPPSTHVMFVPNMKSIFYEFDPRSGLHCNVCG